MRRQSYVTSRKFQNARQVNASAIHKTTLTLFAIYKTLLHPSPRRRAGPGSQAIKPPAPVKDKDKAHVCSSTGRANRKAR